MAGHVRVRRIAAGRAPRLEHVQLPQKLRARVLLEHAHACLEQRLARHHAHLREIRNEVRELRSHVREVQQPYASRRRSRDSDTARRDTSRTSSLSVARPSTMARASSCPVSVLEIDPISYTVFSVGSLVAVDPGGAEVVEVTLPVDVDADARAHAVIGLEPGAAELAHRRVRREPARPPCRASGASSATHRETCRRLLMGAHPRAYGSLSQPVARRLSGVCSARRD